MQPRFCLWIERQKIPCPSERVCCRFVTSKEKSHRLVSDLSGGHFTVVAAVAVFISRKKHGQKIFVLITRPLVLLLLPLMLLYHSVNDRVKLRLCFFELFVARKWEPIEDW